MIGVVESNGGGTLNVYGDPEMPATKKQYDIV
jgi:hypothetical protein